MKKYLPSKKFFYKVIILIILGIILLLILNFSSQKKLFFFAEKEKSRLSTQRATVTDLIQQDTDGDSMLDWEEALWGTDKNNKATFDGVSDDVYIKNKKEELKIENIEEDAEGLTETEKFAREFFASFVALKASGEVDQQAINNFSSALGQKITYPALIDNYSTEDMEISSDESKEKGIEYYSNIKNVFEKYKSNGIGDELDIITNILTTTANTKEKNDKLIIIANSYQGFAEEIIKIAVPQNLADNHLKIVNSANNIDISIGNMAKISTDPIVGLSGLSQYQKYSEELITAVQELEEKLKE